MCDKKGFESQWCGLNSYCKCTTLDVAVFFQETALSPKLWSQTVSLAEILQNVYKILNDL